MAEGNGSAAVLLAVFGLAASFIIRNAGKWPWRLCVAIQSATAARAALEMLEHAALRYRAPMALCEALEFANALAAPVPGLLMTAYFLFCCGESWKGSALIHIRCVLAGVQVSLQAAALLFGGSGFTQDYQFYCSEPWFAVLLSLTAVSAAVDLIALFRRRKKLSKAYLAAFFLCYVSSGAVQIVFLELLILDGLAKSYRAQEQEAARQRTRAAILQMRPHFVYNTMLTIYSLCELDPQKARQVTWDFSEYLQDNFTAIAQEEPIPFTKELEHTQAYLAVERVRFEGRLFVEFDTPHTVFRIPALTLQPIVENAVKHGINPELDPLYISVLTRETDDGDEIIVEDTGPGFVPPDDSQPHIALDNIRERLKTMCGGTLRIDPREAGGTKVTIFIPNRHEKKEISGKRKKMARF